MSDLETEWADERRRAAAVMASTETSRVLDPIQVRDWLDTLADDPGFTLSAEGRASLKRAANTLSFLARQADFQNRRTA